MNCFVCFLLFCAGKTQRGHARLGFRRGGALVGRGARPAGVVPLGPPPGRARRVQRADQGRGTVPVPRGLPARPDAQRPRQPDRRR